MKVGYNKLLKHFDTFSYSSEEHINLEKINWYRATNSIVFNAVSHTISVSLQ